MYGGKGGKTRNIFLLIIILLAGVVVGGFIGEQLVRLADAYPSVSFLRHFGYSHVFGLETPVMLNLSVIVLQFALTIKFSIFGVIGMIVALVIYRKL